MRNYTKVLKIAPAFLLAGTMLHAQTTDTVKTADIEQVVLIGYGKQKKTDLTGSIVSISAKDFNAGSTSPEQLIQGKTPGVAITGNGGAPGSGSTIRIRGGASLNANSSPLIVIDGIPQDFNGISGASDPLSLINPNDIESFDILKDASAAAIYGNRASNGVILITTKKGSAGRLKANFTTMASVSTKMGNVDVLGADEFRSYVTANATPNYVAKLGTANTNWQDLIYQEAWGTDNNLALSGGIKWLPYRLSLGYTEQNGIVRTNSFKRSALGLNLSPKFFDNHLSVNYTSKLTYTDNSFPDGGAINNAIYFDPTQPVYMADQRYGGYYEWLLNGNLNVNGTKNPIGLLNGSRRLSNVFRAVEGLQLDYKFHFLPDLRWNINLGYDYSQGEGFTQVYANSASGFQDRGSYSTYKQKKTNKLLETYLNYVKNITSISTTVDLLGGYSYQNFNNDSPGGSTTFGDPNKVAQSGRDYMSDLTLLSFYGRAIFTIANKYIITGSIRRDGSSRFFNGTTDNVWGDFPAVAVAWKMNEESFLKDISAINTMKLRLGYGITGQQEVAGPYPSFAAYNLSGDGAQYGFGNQFYYMYRPQVYNPNLTWETTLTKNIGLDFGFANNRINGSVDVYQKNTENLLAYVPVPAGDLSNFNNKNVGELENKGFEVTLNLVPVKTDNTTWDLNINATHYRSVVTSLSDQVADNYVIQTGPGLSGGVGNSIQAHTVGEAPSSFFVYQQVYGADGKPLDNVFVDRNGDGEINTSDKYFYKSANPDAIFGFSTKLTHQKWDAGFSLRAVLGNYVYNNAASNSSLQNIATNEFLSNVYSTAVDNNFAAIRLFSDMYVEDASFLRMDNASIGYNFGDFLSKNSNLRVYAMAQNVFVITDYSGVDPEIFGNVDNGFYQRPKVYSLGLNFQF